MSTEALELKLLHRCLSETKWRDLTHSRFYERYLDEVGDESDRVTSTHVADLPSYGPCAVHVLENGLAVLERANKYSLFETRARFLDRECKRQFAEFIRGHWTETVPQKPGRYIVCDRDAGRQSIRELVLVEGRLRDTQGWKRPGRVSEWLGLWWSEAIPLLPAPEK